MKLPRTLAFFLARSISPFPGAPLPDFGGFPPPDAMESQVTWSFLSSRTEYFPSYFSLPQRTLANGHFPSQLVRLDMVTGPFFRDPRCVACNFFFSSLIRAYFPPVDYCNFLFVWRLHFYEPRASTLHPPSPHAHWDFHSFATPFLLDPQARCRFSALKQTVAVPLKQRM